MKTKVIIIIVCVIILWCVVFGYSRYLDAFQDMETIIDTVASLGQTVLNANGLDFNEKLEYFLPDLNDNTFGVYYDENTQELYQVGKTIKSFLPKFITNNDDNNINVSVYPTLYSVDFCYQASVFDITNNNNIGFGELSKGPIRNYKAFGKQYCIRLLITIPNYQGENSIGYYGINKYDVFIFFVDDKIHYFVSNSGSSTGIYSDRLNEKYQYRQIQDVNEKLNGNYELRLDNFTDSFWKTYRFSYTDRVQDTGLYLSSAFDLFMKGE